jgi:hypothetical protein
MHGAENMAHQGASAIGGATHTATDAIGRFASGAKTSIGGAAHAASDTLTHLAHETASQSRLLGHRAEESFESNPLAVGAAFLVVGAAVGWAIPSTAKEDQWMGQPRDEVLERANALAGDACEKVDAAAKEVTAGAKRTEKRATDDKRGAMSGPQSNRGQQDGHAPPTSST